MVIIKTSDACDLFEINASTLTRWKRIGANKASKGRDRWDLKILFNWWLENIYSPLDSDEPTLQAERLRYERARAEKIEIEVKRMKKDLLPREDIEAAIKELIIITKKAFLLLPKTAPGVLKGLSQAEQMKVLQVMVDEILLSLSQGANITNVQSKIKSITG